MWYKEAKKLKKQFLAKINISSQVSGQKRAEIEKKRFCDRISLRDWEIENWEIEKMQNFSILKILPCFFNVGVLAEYF